MWFLLYCEGRQWFIWILPEWWKFSSSILFKTFWSFLNIVNDEKRKSEKRKTLCPFYMKLFLEIFSKKTQVLPRVQYLYIGSAKSRLPQTTLAKEKNQGEHHSHHHQQQSSLLWNRMTMGEEKNLLKICMRKCFSCCFFMHLFSILASHYSNLFISQLTRLFSNVIIFE